MASLGKRPRPARTRLEALVAVTAVAALLVLVLSLQKASGDAGLSGAAQTTVRALLLALTAGPSLALALLWRRRQPRM